MRLGVGLDVTVVEARNRVGGRAHSYRRELKGRKESMQSCLE